MKIQESGENYLEVILNLEEKNGVVRSIDIARELGFSKPSISRAMRILKEAGYVSQAPYGNVSLTQAGRERAKSIYERHQLITRFLTESINLDDQTAEQDACRIEHVISEKTIDCIKNYLQK
jgi:Mn-dependent DtxR family transcriptional regulator